MSRLVEEFLRIKTWEEFDRRREEFRDLSPKEPGVAKHFNSLLPDVGGEIENGIISDPFYEAPEEK